MGLLRPVQVPVIDLSASNAAEEMCRAAQEPTASAECFRRIPVLLAALPPNESWWLPEVP